MRTTTRGVLWEVLAPIIRWPLYSPARLGAAALVLLGILFVTGELTSGQGGRNGDDSVATGAPSPSTTSPDADAGPQELTTPGTRRTVERIARRFVADYIDARLPRKEWLARLERRSSPALAAALETVDQANVQAGRRVVAVQARGVGATAASIEVTTSKGGFTVDLAHSGTRWEVTRVLPTERDTDAPSKAPADV